MMYYPDVPALEPDELELLCHEYLEHNATLDPHLADQMGVKRGLRNLDGTGVLAGITNVSNVIGYDKKEDGTIVPIPGRLVYRGIDIDTLAAEADAHDRFCLRRSSGCCCSAPCPRRSSTPSSASCWSTTASCPRALPTT